MTQKPTVNVCMITYNHEKFIQEAIEGVLMQQCDFEIELILANDCSTDKTDEVIQEIIKTHPRSNWIKYTNHSTNKGMMPNFIWALQQCKGKYIALCEGDDYWTDPLKLQKQVDFLEENKQYSYCGHKSLALKNEILTPIEIYIKEISLPVLLNKNMINTATLVYRRSSIVPLPVVFKNVTAGDWFLQLLALKKGKGYILDDYMSVYRIHVNGIWSSLSTKDMCENGVTTLKYAKLIFNDIKTKLLIDKAIIERRQTFKVFQISIVTRMIIKISKFLN